MTPKDNQPTGANLPEKKIRILWGTDENVPALYANQLYISHAGGTEFQLIFGFLPAPIVFGLEADEIPDKINVQQMARIVISPDVMKAFVKAMDENLQNYEESMKKENE